MSNVYIPFVETPQNPQSFGIIQWVGADQFSIDFHCRCSNRMTVPGANQLAIKCPHCGVTFACTGTLNYVDIEQPEELLLPSTMSLVQGERV